MVEALSDRQNGVAPSAESTGVAATHRGQLGGFMNYGMVVATLFLLTMLVIALFFGPS